MNIYTHYSDSHKELYEDFFKSSLREIYNKKEVSIRAAYHKQTTSEGKFMEAGWLDSMRYKLQVILQAIEENSNDYFIFADTDIVFYNDFIDDLKESLGDKDIACQEDCNSLCAGFFIARGNDKNKKLFTEIYNNFTEMVNDQVALNRLKDMVDYKFLDKEKYYTIGNFYDNPDGTHVWDGVTHIIPPKNMKIHHANYVVGVESKIKLIKMIKEKYLQNDN
tara:strand:+ start:1211 stop:1873 length:663 start_codon:yes stop_codon:yes gene_type:complete